MDGKSDPYVRVLNGDKELISKVVTKTINPVWNEELIFEGRTLQEYIRSGVEMRLFDCDNPNKMEKDELIGELTASLAPLRDADTFECTDMFVVKGRQKGQMQFSVTYRAPLPSADDMQALSFAEGEERVVQGKPLILRETPKLDSLECGKVGAGARVRVAETIAIDDKEGNKLLRVKVLVMAPNKGGDAAKQEVRAAGWLTAVKDGKERLAKVHRRVDVDERRQQYELWNRRLAADRAQHAAVVAAVNRASAEEGGSAMSKLAKQKANAAAEAAADAGTVGPSFAHEIGDCSRGIAFAYGGLYPGTLHAHGELVKTHTVSYSIGSAGKYLLYVGLRQKAMTLPGSPFLIDVRPGTAHAPSTHMPIEALPLRSVVGTKGSLLLRLSDSMGNVCVQGGAPVKAEVDTESVQTTVEDLDDGSYLIAWNGKVSGTYRMHVTIDGAHIVGSPSPITLNAAAPDVTHCDLLGNGVRAAVAGAPAKLEVRCRDAFGNDALPSGDLSYGLLLLQLPSNEKGGTKASKQASKGNLKAAAEAGETLSLAEAELQASYNMPALSKPPPKLSAAERSNLAKTLPSISFEGQWHGSSYFITYVPREAGDFELHAWSDPDGSGTRHFFPGCPFPLQVKHGRASHIGSYLRDAAINQLVSGERLVLRVQMRDEFGNASSLSEEDAEGLHSTLETPSGPVALTLKSTGSTSTAAQAGVGGGEGGGNKKLQAVTTGGIGAYEIVSAGDLMLTGAHVATITLHGQPLHGSPVRFVVVPGPVVAGKSWLKMLGRDVATTAAPIEIMLQLVDKFGNEAEKGEVRVDAKAFGPKASECQVVDCQNGTYTITFSASAVGDYKLQVRLENVDMAPMSIHVVLAEGEGGGSKPPTPTAEQAAKEKAAAKLRRNSVASSAPAEAATLEPRPSKESLLSVVGPPRAPPRPSKEAMMEEEANLANLASVRAPAKAGGDKLKDGGAFTKDEFIEYYGGTDEWEAAIPLGPEEAAQYALGWEDEEGGAQDDGGADGATADEAATAPKSSDKPKKKKKTKDAKAKDGKPKDGKAKGAKPKGGASPAKPAGGKTPAKATPSKGAASPAKKASGSAKKK